MTFDTDSAWGTDPGPITDYQASHTPRNVQAKKKKYKRPEGNIQAECVAYMESLGFIVLRTNAGVWKTDTGHYIHGIQDGGADLHCNAWGMFLAIETKAPKKGLRPAQKAYRDKVEARNGTYIAPHSAADLRAGLCAAYGPDRVASWEAAAAAKDDAKAQRRAALMQKMGQKK